MVKQLVDNPCPEPWSCWTTTSAHRNAADFEEAVDAAASIGSAIVRAGLPVALRSTGADIGVEILRVEDLTRMLDALALCDPRVLKVPPPALRQVLLATKSTSWPGHRPVHRPDPSAIAALGLVGEGTVVRAWDSPVAWPGPGAAWSSAT